MKKIAWGALLTFCAVNMTGCALPEKTRVKHSSQTVSSSPILPNLVDGQAEQPEDKRPGYLVIDDPQGENVEVQEEVVLPTTAYINDRIFEYGRKLDRWKELDSQSVTMDLNEEEAAQMVRCFRRLQNALNGYSELRYRILQADKVEVASKITNEEIFELQKNDIAFIESSCGRLLADSEDKSVGWDKREEGADLAQLETLIDRYASNREYEEIIQVWLRIPEFQVGRVHLRTKILYGNALMYLHQEEKAAEIYQQVVDQMSDSDEQATDLVSLRKVLADLYTASGNYSRAAIEYKKISDDYLTIGQLEDWSKLQLSILDRAKDGSPEVLEYSEILRNYLGFIPERDGYNLIWQTEKFQNSYPYSPVASNVDLIRDSVIREADGWFNGFMNEVDKLAGEKKFDKALRLLDTLPTDIIGTEKQLVIKAKNEELLLAEAVENETGKMAKMQDLQNQWNNGLLLAKGDRYEEAIEVFTNLLDTEYSRKAELKIKEISLDAAKFDRRKAADFFIRFTKTSDLESKKKLLIESRRLLKNILVKYPDVEIAPKVLGNIKRVEQEMNSIDPNLVYMADRQGTAQVRTDGIDRAFDTSIQSSQATQATQQQPAIQQNIQEPLPIVETDLVTPPIQ